MKKAFLLSVCALTLGLAQHAEAASISTTLLRRAKNGDNTPISVVVRFQMSPTSKGRAVFKNLRQQMQTQLNRLGNAGGILGNAIKSGKATPLWLDGSVVLNLSPVQARSIATFPFVAEVFENFKVKSPRAIALSQGSADGKAAPQYLQQLGAPTLWAAGLTGKGIRIGHLDSGIDASHPDLAGKLIAFQEFDEQGGRISSRPHDTTDHGTHTAGLMVGSKTGMAPDAKLISALVLPNDEGTFAQVIAGMQYVLDPDNNPDTNDGANVVNMSLGIPGTYDEFLLPVQNMLKAGVVPVFAIGNFGPNSATTGSPGNIPEAIGVGAVDGRGKVAPFSSRGPVAWQGKINGVHIKPDIAAPGTAIASTVRGGGYGVKSGSSQASPLVAGGVALLLSGQSSLTIEQIKGALYSTASNASNKNNEVGYGVVDFPAAAKKLGIKIEAASAPSPVKPESSIPEAPKPTSKPTPKPTPNITAPQGYSLCGIEGETCYNVAGKEVAFGTNGRYVFGTNDDSQTMLCTVAEWGNHDPAAGVLKGCFVKDVTPAKEPAKEVRPTIPQPSTSTTQPGKTNSTAPRLLLLDDDQGSFNDVTAALRNVIRETAVSGGAYAWNTAQMGAVPLSELRHSDVVIWATGTSRQLSAAHQSAVLQYVKEGGKLIVTGQGLSDGFLAQLGARSRGNSTSSRLKTTDALGSREYTAGTGTVLEAVGNGWILGYWEGQKNTGNPLGDLWNEAASSIFGSALLPSNEREGAIVANRLGNGNSLTLGFGLESLSNEAKSMLLKDSLRWLLGR